jgi:hypothetical protein
LISIFEGLGWLLLVLGPLILFQRALHKELQAVLLLLTRRVEITFAIFTVLFLPGVLLHELSHYLVAAILRVRTREFSLIPKNMGGGRLQLGFVETEKVDFFRDSLIGIAPLLTGGFFVGYAGTEKLGFLPLWDALRLLNLDYILTSMQRVFTQPDFWLWFYLTFVISTTMLPSHSDRQAWLPLIIMIGILGIVGVLSGLGSWMIATLGEPLYKGLRSISVVFCMSAVIHLFILGPMFGTRVLLSKITGLSVKMGN